CVPEIVNVPLLPEVSPTDVEPSPQSIDTVNSAVVLYAFRSVNVATCRENKSPSVTVIGSDAGMRIWSPTVLVPLVVATLPPSSVTRTLTVTISSSTYVCVPLTSNSPLAAVTVPSDVSPSPQSITAVKSAAVPNG